MNKTAAKMRQASQRSNAAAGAADEDAPNKKIRLVNPVSHHWASFIFGNSTICPAVVQEGEARGLTLAICGAGPSLAETADEYLPRCDHVWGCNSAAIYLGDQGHKVTHAFTVDQTAHMVEEWYSAPDLHYLLASTVHPHLTQYLQGKGRTTTFFHNYVGVPERAVELVIGWEPTSERSGACEAQTVVMTYEDWLYSAFYQPTVRLGSGLNAVSRAIDLACYMGYKEVYALGADCALRPKVPQPPSELGTEAHQRWLEDTQMHADGGNALRSGATPVTLTGQIDGRWWTTKPDMAITAVWLVKMAQALPHLHLIGDTLPNALMGKDDAFLQRLPMLTHADGTPITYDFSLQKGYTGLV
jgi:hypothetical protein